MQKGTKKYKVSKSYSSEKMIQLIINKKEENRKEKKNKQKKQSEPSDNKTKRGSGSKHRYKQ